jgi:hypothetical protein
MKDIILLKTACRSGALAATMYRDVQVSREGRMPGVTDAGDGAPAGSE